VTPLVQRYLVKRSLLSVALASVVALAACADDATEWQVTVVVNDTSLVSGSAQTTEVLVSVQDQDRNPVPQGTPIRLQCVNTASGALTGSVGTEQPGLGQTTTDTVGIATFDFRCGDDATLDAQILCRAVYEGTTGNGPVITCVPAQ
jgi:hypothetical protein